MSEENDSAILLAPALQAQLKAHLDEKYGQVLKKLIEADPDKPGVGVKELHLQIQQYLSSQGFSTPEDVYYCLLTSLADEYWCEVYNQTCDGA